MFKNYIKVAWRNLLRNKWNSIVIILSLAIAFTFSNFLLSFIIHETSTDAFHQKKDRIYRLFSNDPMEGEERIRVILHSTLEYIFHNYPEVEDICKVAPVDRKGVVLAANQKEFNEMMVLSASPSFISLFDYPFLEGLPEKALNHPEGIVLAQKTAIKLFKSPPYINKSVELHKGAETRLLTVTGVISSIVEPTQLAFDALVPDLDNERTSRTGSVFISLKRGSDVEGLIKKINSNKNVPSLLGAGKATYSVEPFAAAYFNQENVQPYERSRSKQFIWICWIVIFLISFAAVFNFVNLFVIGMHSRGKELGMRKILGASKGDIGRSIGIEISLYILISFLFSIGFTIELLPFFNTTFNTSLTLNYVLRADVLYPVLLFVLFVGVLMSLYMLYYLRRVDLIPFLRGKIGKKVSINRTILTVQFAVTFGLIICSATVIHQMQFIENKPLGFNRNLLEITAPSADLANRMAVLKDKLLQRPELSSNVALASGNPISGNWQMRLDLDDEKYYSPYVISGDSNLPSVLQLELLEGRSYRNGETSGKLVNEKLIQLLEIKDPVGKTIPGTDNVIVGVVADFNGVSLKNEIAPYIISYNETPPSLLVDISQTDIDQILPLLKEGWQDVFAGHMFDYKLIQDELLIKHAEDIRFFRILIGFTLASILISSFGLFVIASFTIAQRTKEIGVRKVLGASVTNILGLLSLDYIKWLSLGFIISAPIAWYTMNQWLTDFAYRIDLGPGIFAVAGLAALTIALLTVSWQSIRASLANPIKSLRNE